MIQKLTSRVAAWCLETPRWKFLTVVFVVMFFRTGITCVVRDFLPIAKDPYHNPFTNPYEHYLMWSWLGPFLAHLIGATNTLLFSLFYLAFSVLFTVLMVRWMFTRLPDDIARVAMLVFAAMPVSTGHFFWVFTDSLTLFLLACALYFPRHLAIVALLGVGVGMQHFEQGFFAAGAAFFALLWSERRGVTLLYTWKWALALLLGVIAGKLVLVWIFWHLGIHVNSGRLYWLLGSWRMLLSRFGASYHFGLFSAFGAGWLVVWLFLRRRTPDVLPVGLAIIGLLLLIPISDDPTRVFANVTFVLVCVFLLANRDFLGSLTRETVGLIALFWIVTPWVFVWAGKPLGSAAFHDFAWISRHWFHIPNAIRDPRFPI